MKVCPKCKSKDITETIYGLISDSGMKDLEKELEDGKVRLGGCCISVSYTHLKLPPIYSV